MIIKSNNPEANGRPATVDLADRATERESCGVSLQGQAARLIAEARREAERLRREAALEGLREGERAAQEELLRRHEERWATLAPALERLVEEMGRTRQAWLAHWERAAVSLAMAIARRVLRRELAARPEVSLELVREALELAVGNDRVRVLLSPADHASLGARVADLAAQLGGLGPVEVVADAAISPGGCRVETRFGLIDQQIESQLARIEEELASC
jgi:flagellar assembly protein FliH